MSRRTRARRWGHVGRWLAGVLAASSVLALGSPGALPAHATTGAPERSCLSAEQSRMIDTSRADRTQVTVRPVEGSPSEIRDRENHGLNRAAFQPTGRFVVEGETFTVRPTSPTYLGGLRVEVAIRGDRHEGFPGTQATYSSDVPASGQTFTARNSGFLYLGDYSSHPAYQVQVTGGQPVPVWEMGQTTPEDFARQLRDYPGPGVQLVSPRIWVDFQRRWFEPIAQGVDLESRIVIMDQVVRAQDAVQGLDTCALGTDRRHAGPLHVANTDGGAGGAYATSHFVNLHGEGNARALLRSPARDLWVLWHEIGHVYQTPSIRPSYSGEVTVNIPAVSIGLQLFGYDRMATQNVTAFREYMARPLGQRDYHAMSSGADNWVRLRLYDQLIKTFGENLMPRIYQQARLERASGAWQPTTDVDKMDYFASLAGQASQTDLREFFRQWGVPLSGRTTLQMLTYPRTLRTPVWEVVALADATEQIPLDPVVRPWADLTVSPRLRPAVHFDVTLTVPADAYATMDRYVVRAPGGQYLFEIHRGTAYYATARRSDGTVTITQTWTAPGVFSAVGPFTLERAPGFPGQPTTDAALERQVAWGF